MYKKVCITNRELVDGDYFSQIEKVATQGIDYMIVREKDLDEQSYQILFLRVKEICEAQGVVCMLHYHLGVAESLSYKKVHVTMEQFRRMAKAERDNMEILGVSTHTVEEAIEAMEGGASYITASHIFETDCKKGLEPRGLQYLKEVTELVSIPVFALGGIQEDTICSCIKAGAAGVCMMSSYMRL